MPLSPGGRKIVVLLVVGLATAALGFWKFRPIASENPSKTIPEQAPLRSTPLRDLPGIAFADRQILAIAENHYHLGRPAEAIESLNGLSTLDHGPAHLRGALLTGLCCIEQDRGPEALALFQMILEHRPDDPDALTGLANAHIRIGSTANAAKVFERVAELRPADLAPLEQAAQLYIALARFGDVERTAKAFLAKAPPTPPDRPHKIRLEYAAMLVDRNQADDGLAVLGNAAGAVPHALRAEAYLLKNELDAAEKEARGAMTAADGFGIPLVRLVRAKVHLARGEAAEAALILEKMIADDPHDYKARAQLSNAWRTLGRTAEATAEQIRGKEAMIRHQKVNALLQTVSSNPQDAAARRELATAFDAVGRPELALRCRAVADKIDAARATQKVP
ncbi:MAG: tetratricopeptide repeat protein [Gemmataceae bacterium]